MTVLPTLSSREITFELPSNISVSSTTISSAEVETVPRVILGIKWEPYIVGLCLGVHHIAWLVSLAITAIVIHP